MHSPYSETPCYFGAEPPTPTPSLTGQVPPRADTHLRRAGDVRTAPIEWLWPRRIPIGKVTLLVGDPGLGKSLLAFDIAARVSTGAVWPDEAKAEGGSRKAEGNSARDATASAPPPSPLPLPPSSVLLLNSEDDLADTIRPRLEAHGADCRRIFHVDSVVDLRTDFDQLRAAVNRTPDCRLIIVDPASAFVGPNDSHFHTVVRKVLAPLAKLAAQKRLAVLAVAHLRKHEGAAIHRAAGSIGFIAAARAVWTICRDPSQPGRQLLVPLKSNLAAAAPILSFSIESHPTIDAPIVRWHPLADDLSVDDALSPPQKPRGPQAEELRAAQNWLREFLAPGRQSAHDVIDAGEQRGFNARTLRRGLRTIGGHTEKLGLLGGWWWALPETPKPSKRADPEKPVPFEDNLSPSPNSARQKAAQDRRGSPVRSRNEA